SANDDEMAEQQIPAPANRGFVHQKQQAKDARHELAALRGGVLNEHVILADNSTHLISREQVPERAYRLDGSGGNEQGNAGKKIGYKYPFTATRSAELHEQQWDGQKPQERVKAFPTLVRCHTRPQHSGEAEPHEKHRQTAGWREQFPANI